MRCLCLCPKCIYALPPLPPLSFFSFLSFQVLFLGALMVGLVTCGLGLIVGAFSGHWLSGVENAGALLGGAGFLVGLFVCDVMMNVVRGPLHKTPQKFKFRFQTSPSPPLSFPSLPCPCLSLLCLTPFPLPPSLYSPQVSSAVAAVLVCFVEDPSALQYTHPEYHNMLVGAWAARFPTLSF